MTADNNPAFEAAHFGMGTLMSHKAFGPSAQKALDAVKAEAQRLEHLLSRFIHNSEISRINAAAGKESVAVCDETFGILQKAQAYSLLSQGLFDITIAPLAGLWDYKHAVSPPPDAQIRQSLGLIGYDSLTLDAANKTARLQKAGQAIDLGGIAKGYASDRFMEIFLQYGVASAFSNIGGNVSTLGRKEDGSSWRVGIRHPRSDRLIGAVSVDGQSVVTSGDYERYFIDAAGRRWHHILNPKTGYPAQAGLVSVTIVAQSAMDADALSTAIFVAGMQQGLAMLHTQKDIEAVFVDEGLSVYVTPGLQHCYQSAQGAPVYV
jgi:thiamine biosynthesis lipoprotein